MFAELEMFWLINYMIILNSFKSKNIGHSWPFNSSVHVQWANVKDEQTLLRRLDIGWYSLPSHAVKKKSWLENNLVVNVCKIL